MTHPILFKHHVDAAECSFSSVLEYKNIRRADGTRPDVVRQGIEAMLQLPVRHIVHKIRQRLRPGGVHSYRNLRRLFHNMDLCNLGLNTCTGFCGVLNYLAVWVGQDEFRQLSTVLRVDVGNCDVAFDYVLFLQLLCGDENARLNEQRLDVLAEAFAWLATKTEASICVSDMNKLFHPRDSNVADAYGVSLEPHERVEEFLKQWVVPSPDGLIEWMDFLDYYLDISMFVESDEDFVALVQSSWGMSEHAKKVTQAFQEHDATGLGELDFAGFSTAMRGVDPDMTDEEVAVSFRMVDFDGSQSVSFQEFQNLNIMKYKIWFDRFDSLHKRTLTFPQFQELFHQYASALEFDLILGMYRSIDIDGSGEISFAEFIESNLLRVVDLWYSYDIQKKHSLVYNVVKQFLMDTLRTLTADDVETIFRVLDKDRSGTISLFELIDSNIFKVVQLFRIHDKFRRRSLTRQQLNALLMEFHPTLSGEDLAAVTFYINREREREALTTLPALITSDVLQILKVFNRASAQSKVRQLDHDQLFTMLTELNPEITSREVDLILSIFDSDRSGSVSLSEFIGNYRAFQLQFQRHRKSVTIQRVFRGRRSRRQQAGNIPEIQGEEAL